MPRSEYERTSRTPVTSWYTVTEATQTETTQEVCVTKRKSWFAASATSGAASETPRSASQARCGRGSPKKSCVKYTETIGATASDCASSTLSIRHPNQPSGRPSTYAG